MRLQYLRRRPYPALLATIGLGLCVLILRPLTWLSYDLSYVARGINPVTITNLVVVSADGASMTRYNNGYNEIDRLKHAQLLTLLHQAKSGPVFYDYLFATNRDTREDKELAAAIEAHGNVFLAAAGDDKVTREFGVRTVYRPASSFCNVASNWGHTVLVGDVIREIPGNWGVVAYGPWVMATNLHPVRFAGQTPNGKRWLNFYDLPFLASIPQYSFDQVLSDEVPSSVFRDKFVFVGHGFPTAKQTASPEMYATPYLPLNRQKITGVLIHATAFLNLWRDDWLREIPFVWQSFMTVLWAFVTVMSLYWLSRRSKVLLIFTALAAASALCVISLYVQWQTGWWWSWLGPVTFQTGFAVAYVWFNPRPDPYFAFISYRVANDDNATAVIIRNGLEDRGYKVYVDTNSPIAGKFGVELLQTIEESTFVILILSPEALDQCVREDCWLRREILHAIHLEKDIVPFCSERFDWSKVPNLSFTDQLKGYERVTYGHSVETGVEQLIQLLERTQEARKKRTKYKRDPLVTVG